MLFFCFNFFIILGLFFWFFLSHYKDISAIMGNQTLNLLLWFRPRFTKRCHVNMWTILSHQTFNIHILFFWNTFTSFIIFWDYFYFNLVTTLCGKPSYLRFFFWNFFKLLIVFVLSVSCHRSSSKNSLSRIFKRSCEREKLACLIWSSKYFVCLNLSSLA